MNFWCTASQYHVDTHTSTHATQSPLRGGKYTRAVTSIQTRNFEPSPLTPAPTPHHPSALENAESDENEVLLPPPRALPPPPPSHRLYIPPVDQGGEHQVWRTSGSAETLFSKQSAAKPTSTPPPHPDSRPDPDPPYPQQSSDASQHDTGGSLRLRPLRRLHDQLLSQRQWLHEKLGACGRHLRRAATGLTAKTKEMARSTRRGPRPGTDQSVTSVTAPSPRDPMSPVLSLCLLRDTLV